MVGVVLSPPVLQSALPTETTVTEQPEEARPVAESTDVEVTPTPQPENHVNQPVSESNHVVTVTEPTNEDAAKGSFLSVSSVPMGRSSRYCHSNTFMTFIVTVRI